MGDIMKSDIIYDGDQKCRFIYDGRYVNIPEYLDKEIKENWDELIKAGKPYTNDELFTITNIEFNNKNDLIFNLKKTNFAHHMYCRKKDFNIECVCRSIATSALFLTNDDYYVFGKMSSSTSLAGITKFIGGTISSEDFIDNEFNSYECVKREVKEEVGIDLNDKSIIQNVDLHKYLTLENFSFINVCYKVRMNISSKEMMSFFISYDEYLGKNNLEQELETLVFVKNNKDDVLMFLEDNKDDIMSYLKDLLLVEVGIKEARVFKDDACDGKLL